MEDLNKAYRGQTTLRRKKDIGYNITKWVVFGVFIIYGASLLFPFIWMLVSSFKTTNEFDKNVFVISLTVTNPKIRAPIQSTFASLCCRVSSADFISPQQAALIPFILFAAILIPIPVPHKRIPKSASFERTQLHTFFA